MRCPNCNAWVSGDESFCGECGARVVRPAPPPATPEAVVEKGGSARMLLGGAVAAAAGLAALVVCLCLAVVIVASGMPGPAEPASRPTQAAQATRTPVPTQTSRATALSIVAIPTSTATPHPTNTPRPAPTRAPSATAPPAPTAPCPVSLDRQLAALWDGASLGCPTENARIVWCAWQPFERGYMLWRQDTRTITVLFQGGHSAEYPDRWTGQALPSRGAPPAGRYSPVHGFGYLWSTEDAVFGGLGWGTEEEKGFCALVQDCERGLVLHSSDIPHCQGDEYNWATNADFHPLALTVRQDGSWTRH